MNCFTFKFYLGCYKSSTAGNPEGCLLIGNDSGAPKDSGAPQTWKGSRYIVCDEAAKIDFTAL